MSEEKIPTAFGSFMELKAYVKEIDKLIAEGQNFDSPEMYQAALDLFDQTRSFTEKLEDLDENMNLENTKLPNVDELFENSPLTDYINARVDYALGDKSEENIERIVQSVKAINGEAEEELEDEYPCPVDCTPEDCACKDYEDEYPSVYEYVTAVSEDIYDHINTLLEVIDLALQDVQEFDSEDIELARFYLKHLPMNSEIEGLSDRAIELAYKTRRNAQLK